MEAIKTCLPEDFKSLKLKTYRNFPRALLKAIIKELPDYAAVVYLTLYDLAELNFRYPGTVVITHKALAEELGKSGSSVRRAIDTLRDLGYIEIKQQGQSEKNYLPNIIRVCCPKVLADKIQAEELDRKLKGLSLQTSPLKPTIPLPEPLDKAKEQECLISLYEQYQEAVKHFREAGNTPLIAFRRAYETFSKEEALGLQKYILELPNSLTNPFISPALSKMEGGCSKMNTIRSINNRDHDLLLTIGANTPVNNMGLEMRPLSPIVDFQKKSSVIHLRDEMDKREVIRKIKAMYRDHEIHADILNGYQNNISQLIVEIVFQIQFRDPKKFQTSKHALNACAKMLREGVWSTPKKMLQNETIAREKSHLQNKQQELQAALSFFKKNNLRNLIGRICM